MHESLVSKEELVRSEDMGDYIRVRLDGRDLNYEKYLSEGEKKLGQLQDYSSQNASRLTVQETEELLIAQPEIISALNSKETENRDYINNILNE